jgi:hypothetical protein
MTMIDARARRGSYFYVIDAFIASIIIVSAIIIIFSRYSAAPSSTQALYTAEDYLTTMESATIRSIDASKVRNWTANGTISDESVSALEQLARFAITSCAGFPLIAAPTTSAGQFVRLTADNAPAHVGMLITATVPAGECTLYNSTAERGTMEMGYANALLSSRRILLVRSSPLDTYPPVIIEVRTWQ